MVGPEWIWVLVVVAVLVVAAVLVLRALGRR
jgi:bacteriorhodopsin